MIWHAWDISAPTLVGGGGKQLVSLGWARLATAPQVPPGVPIADTEGADMEGSGCYGFNWWLNGVKGNGEWGLPGAPTRLSAMFGLAGNGDTRRRRLCCRGQNNVIEFGMLTCRQAISSVEKCSLSDTDVASPCQWARGQLIKGESYADSRKSGYPIRRGDLDC